MNGDVMRTTLAGLLVVTAGCVSAGDGGGASDDARHRSEADSRTASTAGDSTVADAGPAALDSEVGLGESEDTSPSPAPCEGRPETCNGADDDCDGHFDEATGGEPCPTGLPGTCGPGRTACDGGRLGCLPVEGATVETCDGLDNDCDGRVDNLAGVGNACLIEDGHCAIEGLVSCGPGGLHCEPMGEPMGEPERCNEVDDDCDGQVDEGDVCVVPEDCANQFDDDGDGHVDCADVDCFRMPPCPRAYAPLGRTQAFGHHGDCDSFNDCVEGSVCAIMACVNEGEGLPIGWKEGRCSTVAADVPTLECHLFNNLDHRDLDREWGPRANCDIPVVYDVRCENGP